MSGKLFSAHHFIRSWFFFLISLGVFIIGKCETSSYIAHDNNIVLSGRGLINVDFHSQKLRISKETKLIKGEIIIKNIRKTYDIKH